MFFFRGCDTKHCLYNVELMGENNGTLGSGPGGEYENIHLNGILEDESLARGTFSGNNLYSRPTGAHLQNGSSTKGTTGTSHRRK